VVFILLLLVVGLQPLIKLYFLNPTERFRFADACMLAANSVMVLMAMTVLLLEYGAYFRAQRSANSGLETLARIVEKKLTGEFRRMRTQLVTFTDRFDNCDVSPEDDVKNLLNPGERYRDLRPEKYRDLSQVTWINPQGKQIFKATVNPELTPRISVRGRTYFTEPSYRKAQHLWSFRREEELKDASSPRFFVQSTRSWTTADLSTDLSISLSHKKNLRNKEKTCEGYVAEISAPPLAVERPLLAAGYDFAVIAGDGQVLYHSDPRRTLKENFFAEVDNPDDVHAAIQSRAGRHLKTLYARRPSELFIRPLDLNNAGWFVVTLRDRGWIYAVATETLVYAMAWCCLSWLASTLVLLMVFLRSGKERLHYWWPTPQKGKFYQTLTGIYAFLLIGGLAVVVRADPVGSGLFRFSLAFPLIAAVTTVMMHWRSSYDRAPQGDLHRTSYWTWYVAALAAMWAAAGIVPAAGLFRHSWHLKCTSSINTSELVIGAAWMIGTPRTVNTIANERFPLPLRGNATNYSSIGRRTAFLSSWATRREAFRFQPWKIGSTGICRFTANPLSQSAINGPATAPPFILFPSIPTSLQADPSACHPCCCSVCLQSWRHRVSASPYEVCFGRGFSGNSCDPRWNGPSARTRCCSCQRHNRSAH